MILYYKYPSLVLIPELLERYNGIKELVVPSLRRRLLEDNIDDETRRDKEQKIDILEIEAESLISWLGTCLSVANEMELIYDSLIHDTEYKGDSTKFADVTMPLYEWELVLEMKELELRIATIRNNIKGLEYVHFKAKEKNPYTCSIDESVAEMRAEVDDCIKTMKSYSNMLAERGITRVVM